MMPNEWAEKISQHFFSVEDTRRLECERMVLRALDDMRSQIRGDTVRELDAKYNRICEIKVNAAIEQIQNRLSHTEQTNSINTATMLRGRARNQKLEAVVEAAAYCYRHHHIDEAAVKFTGLDKHLDALQD